MALGQRHGPDQFRHADEGGRLGEEGGDAERLGAADVAQFPRGGEDGDGEVLEGGLGAEPFDDFETVFERHFQIEEDEAGTGEGGVFEGPLQVMDGFFAIADVLDGIAQACPGEGAADEKSIVKLVFSQQDEGTGTGGGGIVFFGGGGHEDGDCGRLLKQE